MRCGLQVCGPVVVVLCYEQSVTMCPICSADCGLFLECGDVWTVFSHDVQLMASVCVNYSP